MENKLSVLSRRSLLLLGTASLALAACSNIIGPPDASQIYTLHPPMPAPIAGTRLASLAVELPDAPENLDTDRIAITRSTNTADYFAGAVWSDKLTDIVQDSLLQALEASGFVDEVVRDTEGVSTDFLLRVDIRDFQARYDQPDGLPTAVVTMEAKLIDRGSRNVTAHHTVHEESAATQNNIGEAVNAMNRALGAALKDIVGWTASVVPQTPSAAPPPRRRHRVR